MKIEAYKKLESLFNRISLISESISVLHWDAATKMPKRGAHARSGQIAELKKISHDLLVNKETSIACLLLDKQTMFVYLLQLL